ncbi:MAG: hypothetical protein V4659_01605 [Pseudomonadota bacterium]
MLLALALLAAPALARDSIGTFGRWGAFRETSPRHCFAIAQPVQLVGGTTTRAFASIARWPASNIRAQLHVRLSRPRDPRAAVTLSIGERRFQLTAGDLDGWASDTRTDRAIVAAIRSGRSLSVESIGRDRRAIADIYSLAGAATAIDAATVACAGN